MTITEAKSKCEKLQKQMEIVEEEYFAANGYAKYVGEQEIEPLWKEWSKLQTLITKTENETKLIK